MNVYDNDELVGELTQSVLADGESVLQIHLLAETEEAHVDELLAYCAFPHGAIVLDLGCGVGAVADMMQRTRHDLDFILLNISSAQLALCPGRFARVLGSFEDIPPLPMDPTAAMLQYALGHGDVGAIMREAARVLPEGAPLCIYDLASNNDSVALQQELGYRAYSLIEISRAAAAADFASCDYVVPKRTYVERFYKRMPKERFDEVFAGVFPVLLRFIR